MKLTNDQVELTANQIIRATSAINAINAIYFDHDTVLRITQVETDYLRIKAMLEVVVSDKRGLKTDTFFASVDMEDFLNYRGQKRDYMIYVGC